MPDELDAGTQALVEDLNKKPPSVARDRILRAALEGHYHDFRSEHVTPKLVLIGHLLQAGFHDLAESGQDGKYDQGKEEADKWAQSGEGQEAATLLGKGR
jgi:hypothetical protein